MAESVRDLTSSIASGDTEAFARLYRAWLGDAMREARHCSGRDEQFCLDVVHDAMVRVITRLKPLDSQAALAAWLRTAVRNACIDRLRQEARRRAREHAASQVSPQADAPQDTALEEQERLEWLRRELAAIEPTSARALDLRFRLNWTLTRIAQTLGLKPGAVDGRLSRSIERLRAAAEEHPYD